MQELYHSKYIIVVLAITLIAFLTCFAPLTNTQSTSILVESTHAGNISTTLVYQNVPIFHVASAGPATGNATKAAPAPAVYDEQIGETFTQSFTSLTYNVTAVAQQDQDGYGPAYLLNGLTNMGYWYQVGISWNWAALSGGYAAGFHMNYNVFDSTAKVVLPSDQSGGLMSLSGPVNQGNIVELSLFFSGGNVQMHVYDWNTSASAQISYSSEGANQFVGLSAYANSNGFFTGLMTEQYHGAPYYGSEQKVLYSNTTFALTSAFLWIDEYNVNNLTSLFGGNIQVFFTDPTLLQTYTLDGATESANANNLITGSVNSVQLTFSYSATGGAGYSTPTLYYISNGFQQSVNLTTSPTVYSVDSGTSWSVINLLPGSSPTEKWITNQTTSGTATSSQRTNFVYYHQFLVTFNYSVIGGGNGYSAPSVTSFQFGSSFHPALLQQAWVDADSQYSYTNPLAGSTQSERWQATSSTAQISSSVTITQKYYHQFAISSAFTVSNGGTPSTGPTFTSESFGVTNSSILATTPMPLWADVGSNYSVSSAITGAQERWITNSSVAGTVTYKKSLDFVYDHQFYLTVQSSVQAGGTVSPASGWVNAGNNVEISNAASQGWKFEFWTGSGSGSYTGSANTTTINMQAPIIENATFYVGFTIDSAGDGSVSYSFSNSGNVQVTTQTVYVPSGTVVTLNANPSSFLYKLDSWSGAAGGSSAKTSVTITSPATVQAQFGYNMVSIGGIIAVVVIVAVGVVALLVRSKKPNMPN